MGRFFCALALCALLIFAGGRMKPADAQPVFFSMLFPQLMDFGDWFGQAATPGEAQVMEAIEL